ncbi:MAG: tRNA pseudouridine(38-40) synthase TruA [Alphaproteobacteria bacterium]|jgi:tRNA pseudouridine38-40 synthase|nr:tRNA pseudouridine(38-40) synthase TruA [Alphaproteobacteria bacterium]
MTRYKISVEYNGTKFHGWQKQLNLPTVQQAIEDVLFKLAKKTVEIFCAGRTDTGVHAIEQVASFDMEKDFSPWQLQQALNFHLKGSGVAIFNVENLGENSNFHARFSAKKREYLYKILNRDYPPTFDELSSWWIPQTLNLENMITASKFLIGNHDFSSFRASGCQASSPIKTIDEINFVKNGDIITMHIAAPSFLYHQVRNIMGSIYLVGRGKISPKNLQEMLEAKDRTKGGPTAPPHGLYFLKVSY